MNTENTEVFTGVRVILCYQPHFPAPFYSLIFSALLFDLGGDSPWTESLDSFTPGSGWVGSMEGTGMR